MEREVAKSYVRYSMQLIDTYSKKLCFQFLPFNLGCAVIALILCHDLIFSITVGVAVAANLITSFLYRAKWSVACGFLSVATQLLLFVIALDQFGYAVYQEANLFVWYEYVAGIGVQLLSVFVSIFIVAMTAKRFRGDKMPYKNSARIGGIVGSTVYAGSSVCFKIFFKDVSTSLSFSVDMIFICINIIVFILSYMIVAACSRVYLIRKYHLNFDEKEEEGQASDERSEE